MSGEMLDVSKLTVDRIYKNRPGNRLVSIPYSIEYTYKNRRGLSYVYANDELGAYQGLLKQLEERYENG